MNDLPSLPDSNDPHELLGVPENADELTVKRAYLRLIRMYRPERTPEAFQRLHQAYERALEQLRWRRWIDPGDTEEDDPESPGAWPSDDLAHVPLQRVWETLAAGDPRAAWQQLMAAQEARPGCVVTAVHRALLAEALDTDPDGATDPLVALLGTDAPAAPWITGLFRPQDVGPSLTTEPGRWARLRAQPARHAAAQLLRRRWHRLLLSGRTTDAISEALAPPYLDDAHDDPSLLAHAAQEVAIAAAWRHPKEAERLLQEHGHGAADDDGTFTLEDQYHVIRMEDLDGAFRRALAVQPPPLLLERWFTLWPILDPDELVTLAREVAADVEDDPMPYLTAFDRMAAEAPELIVRQGDSVRHAGVPADAEVPLLQRERVKSELDRLAGSLPRRQTGRRRRHYHKNLRAVFMHAIVDLALNPRHISWWLSSLSHRGRDTRGSNALAYHQDTLLEDLGMAGLYWTCRLRELPELIDE